MDEKLKNALLLSELAIPELPESLRHSMTYLSRNGIRFSVLYTTNQLDGVIISTSRWS